MRYIALLVLGLTLYGHPHFFIESSIKIEKNILFHQWKFDKLNSKLLLFEFDTNKDKRLDAQEKERFLQNHFYPLQINNFNLFLQSDDKEPKITPQNIQVSLQKKQLVLEFESSLDFEIQAVICTIDATLYMAYMLKELKSVYPSDVQKSDYDFCIGVTK